MSDDRCILLIDAYNLFIRNFCANPLMAEGQHVGGVMGFLQSLNLLIAAHKPKECVIVWEGGGSTRRRAIYPEYKSRRRPVKLNRFHEGEIPDTHENQNWQVKLLIHLMKNLPVKQIYVSDCEADDVIGYLSKYSYNHSRVMIVSSDHDYLQLVSDRVTVWSPTLKKVVDLESVKERMGVYPHNLVVARAFCGDSSDTLPGVKGVGLKTLIKRFPSLAGEDVVEIDDIMSEVNSSLNKRHKVYESMKNGESIARMNWKLMNLDVSNLSWNQVSRVNSAVESPTPDGNKFELIRSLIKAGIKTFDIERLYLNATANLRGNNVRS
jgi:DNA polymerase-1